jgi:hypothetical protein
MHGRVALVHEQGQDFAVLLVKEHVIASSALREEVMTFGEREFGMRTALLGERGQTWGPPDIVNWLSSIYVEQLPWRDFSIEN